MHRVLWQKVDRIVGKRRLMFCLAIPVAIAGAFGVRGALHEETKPDPIVASVMEPPTVQLAQPQMRAITRVVGQPSFVEAYERTSIYPKVTGYIKAWKLDIGDKVKKGQVLATIFAPEIPEDWETKKAQVKLNQERVDLALKLVKVAEADVKAAEAHLDETKAILIQYQAQVDRWKSEVVRLEREVKRGVVDPQVLLESENQYKSSIGARDAAKAAILKAEADLLSKQATLEKAKVAVDVARADVAVARSDAKRLEAWVGYLTLAAPFDGIVVARNANTEDFVSPGKGDPTAMHNAPHLAPGGGAAPIFVVDRTDVVRIFVDVPEEDANDVKTGNKASVQVRAFRDQWIPAKVTRTSWALNTKSRTLRAEIDLVNTDNPGEYVDKDGKHPMAPVKATKDGKQILPGMYAYGKVTIERKAMALPAAALFHVGEHTYYWTYKNGKAVRTEVQTGVSDGQWIEVTNRQLPSSTSDQENWAPIDGSEQVILTEDLAGLAEGQPVQVPSAPSDSKVARTTQGRETGNAH